MRLQLFVAGLLLVGLLSAGAPADGASESLSFSAPFNDSWFCHDTTLGMNHGEATLAGNANAQAATGYAEAGVIAHHELTDPAASVKYTATVDVSDVRFEGAGAEASLVLRVSQYGPSRTFQNPFPVSGGCLWGDFGAVRVPVTGTGRHQISLTIPAWGNLLHERTYFVGAGVEAKTARGSIGVGVTLPRCLEDFVIGRHCVPPPEEILGCPSLGPECVPDTSPQDIVDFVEANRPQLSLIAGSVMRIDAEITPYPELLSDLEVGPIVTQNTPTLGDVVHHRVTVTNRGAGPSPTARIVLDSAFNYSCQSSCLEQTLESLPAGASREVILSHPATDGCNSIWVTVDRDDVVVEGREDNNAQNLWYCLRADLVVDDVQTTPANPSAGDAVRLSVTVRNQGTGQIGSPSPSWDDNFTVRFDVSGSTLFTRLPVPRPGASASASVCCWTAVNGAHLLLAQANALLVLGGATPESNYNNNAAARAVIVGIAARPDLVVHTLSVTPTSPTEGDSVTVSATIKNQGNAAAGSFDVRVAVDGTTIGGDVPVTSLAAGASTTLTRTWVATAGLHEVRATADVTNKVAESDETNNQKATSVNVAVKPVRGVELSPPSQSKTVAPRGSTTYDLVVKNTGNQPDTVQLTQSGTKNGWTSSLSTSSLSLLPGQSATVTLTVDAAATGTLTVTVRAASQSDANAVDEATCQTRVQK